MFRRKKKAAELKLPALEELELWVPAVISALDLKKGEFTLLPAFGGIFLYIRNEGIVWIPYKEIQKTLGRIDKGQLTQNTAILGGTVAAATVSLPAAIIFKGSFSLLKSTYQAIVKPPPKKIIMYVHSIIDEIIIIEDKKLSNKLINQMEENPFKDREKHDFVYKLYIKKKFFDPENINKENRLVSTLKVFGSSEAIPEFTIPSQSNIEEFIDVLKSNNLEARVADISDANSIDKDTINENQQ